jgi:hypothetical protein
MEYTPRYRQPFTLEQAIQLDIATITDGLFCQPVISDNHNNHAMQK